MPASGQQVWAQCGRPQRTQGGSEDRALEGDPDVQAVSGRDSSPARRPRPRPPSVGSAAQGAGRLWPQRVALRASTPSWAPARPYCASVTHLFLAGSEESEETKPLQCSVFIGHFGVDGKGVGARAATGVEATVPRLGCTTELLP